MAQQRNLDDPGDNHRIRRHREESKQSRRTHAPNAGRRPGHKRGSVGRIGKSRSFGNSITRPRSTSPTRRRSTSRRKSNARRLQRERSAAQLPPDFAEEIEAHFEFMPDNYFRAFDGERHCFAPAFVPRFFCENVFAPDESALPPAIKWEAFPEQGHSIASFCTWDRRQLLAKIAGSFSVVPINILSADIYTRGDNLVLDVFRVCRAQRQGRDRPGRAGNGRATPLRLVGQRGL